MTKALGAAYSAIVYVVFLLSFAYAIPFLGDFLVPKTVDSAPAGPALAAVVVDLLLLGVFAVQHSLMARPAFKAWWTKIVPPPIERSTYVLFASLALMLIFWQWRALPRAVWSVQSPAIATVIRFAFWAGWAMVLLSTFLINHFDLFGLRQVWAYRRAQQIPPPEFRTPLFYKVVRHPLYLGFIIAFWAAPTMSQGHLFFALATTAYILIAIQLEEHDMVAVFGERYLAYRKQVSMLIPLPRPGRQSRPASPG